MSIDYLPAPTRHEQDFQMSSNMIYGCTTGATGAHSDDHMMYGDGRHMTCSDDSITSPIHDYDTIDKVKLNENNY